MIVLALKSPKKRGGGNADDRRRDAYDEHPGSRGKANHRHQPQASCRRQALYGDTRAENRASTKESNSRQRLRYVRNRR